MNNPPISALILGDTGPDEFRPVLELVQRHVAPGVLREAADLATFRQMTGSGWFPDFLIALQAWPDQFSANEVEELISLCPLARMLCCFGPWCDSDGRTRSSWPLGVRVTAAAFASRFEHEVALLASNRDAGPPLPLTASRTEIFEFDFGRSANSQLKNGDWLRPAGRNSEQSARGDVPVPVFQPAAPRPPSAPGVSVISPDRRFREMLVSAFRTAGFPPCKSDDTVAAAAIVFDADPWDGDRAQALATIRAAHPRSQLVACVGFPRPHIDAELRRTGANDVWFKLTPLADLIEVLEFRL